MAIELVIWDGDDTLWDSTGTYIKNSFEKAAAELEMYGASETCVEYFRKQYESPKSFRESIRCLEGKVPDEALARAAAAYEKNQEISGLRLIEPYARLFLGSFRSPRNPGFARMALVTRGDPEQQEEKIRMVGIRDDFNDVRIIPSEGKISKRDCFGELAEKYGAAPDEVLVVDDKIDEGIRIANELGMRPARFMHGRHSAATPVKPSEIPAYNVSSINEVYSIVSSENMGRWLEKNFHANEIESMSLNPCIVGIAMGTE